MKRITALAMALKALETMNRDIIAYDIQIGKRDNLINSLPYGSGFDAGSQLLDETRENRIVFGTSFHHMDEHGYYNGWTDHKVIVTPDLSFGFDIRVTGKNRNDIKEYIADVFQHWCNEEI